MKLEKVSLVNFRNYLQRDFEFDDPSVDSTNSPQASSGLGKVSVVVGKNTAGKTNLLEAVCLLATGESFREGKIEEMVNWDGEVGHVKGTLRVPKIKTQISKIKMMESADADDFDQVELQVTVTRGVVQGKRVSKRRYMVNGVARSKQKLLGNLVVVCFRPEDMRIVEGSPGRRRNFLDEVLVQVDSEYGRSLGSYGRGLVRRNKVLQMIREGRTNRTALAFWDQLVVKEGMVIQDKRRGLAEFFNRNIRIQLELPSREAAEGQRNSAGENVDDFFGNLQMGYRPSVMSEKRLKQYEYEEVAAGHTLVGPHRDDFVVLSTNNQAPITKQSPITNHQSPNGRNLAVYGSRGEQRLGVLWLKLMSMEYVEYKLGVRPVLLLDDIFSELDEPHRKLVWGVVGKQQTIVTTADENQLEPLKNGYQTIRL